MISYKEEPNKKQELLNILHPLVREWFFSRFDDFSLPQLFGVMDIHSRENILVSAPTGATKTLTSFLSVLNELVDSSKKKLLQDKVYCVYVSPLKALNEDIRVNLLRPLREIEDINGSELGIRVGVRTGDTTAAEKAKMTKKPPHILITTPESLAIVLSTIKFSEHLKGVQWCIIDEIHSLAENKRGVHLSLSLERLQRLSGHMTRVGLSATVSPLDEIARYLVGYEVSSDGGAVERDCKIIDVQYMKDLDLKVLSPVKNLIDSTHEEMHEKMYSLMHKLIQKHKTTLIFTNTRAATERVVDNLKDRYPRFYDNNSESYDALYDDGEGREGSIEEPIQGTIEGHIEVKKEGKKEERPEYEEEVRGKNPEENRAKDKEDNKGYEKESDKEADKEADKDKVNPGNIGAHHGSLSKEMRHNIEERLRKGDLKVVVSSTSLELGIDIGYIDLVILLGSPKSVARAIQRCGRAGHQLHETTKGRIIVLSRDDLVECSVLLKSAVEKKIDRVYMPRNCLDVLAQQIYGIAIYEKISYRDLFNLVRGSYSFFGLSHGDFRQVIDYLSGKFSSLEDRNIYAKIWYEEEKGSEGMIGRRGKLARVLYMTNIGTIPDETYVLVKVGEAVVGKIDEAFLEKLRRGDVFVLGGQKYEFLYARGMTAQVRASVMRPPTIPNWFSEMLPLSFDLGMEIQRFRRLMDDKLKNKVSERDAVEFILSYLHVDENAAYSLYSYFMEQYEYSVIPHDKRLLIETYEENGSYITVFHTLYGRRVNDCLSRAVALALSRIQKRDIEIGIDDNGFFLRSGRKLLSRQAFKLLKADKLDIIMRAAIEKTEVLRRRFRHCAGRSLMILRNYMGRAKRVGRQQVSSQILINAVKRIDDNFPILKEARREVLEDLMDINGAKKVLKMIEEGKVEIVEKNLVLPSPFSFNLVLQGHMDLMRAEDKVEFLRNMHKMVLAKISLNKTMTKENMESLGSDRFLETDDESFDYEADWEKQEEEREKREEIKNIDLKIEVSSISDLEGYYKDEINKLIDGDKDIRSDVADDMVKRKEEFRERFSEELFNIVFGSLDTII